MIADEVGRFLRERQLTVAVAESCTGGLVGSMLASVAGSSDYFLGGVIAYANRVKTEQLSVSKESLVKYGAVSSIVACQMAEGVKNLLRADITVSVTGIAGPAGGSEDKPVGTVFIGLATKESVNAKRYNFSGNRTDIQRQTALAALEMILGVGHTYDSEN